MNVVQEDFQVPEAVLVQLDPEVYQVDQVLMDYQVDLVSLVVVEKQDSQVALEDLVEGGLAGSLEVKGLKEVVDCLVAWDQLELQVFLEILDLEDIQDLQVDLE